MILWGALIAMMCIAIICGIIFLYHRNKRKEGYNTSSAHAPGEKYIFALMVTGKTQERIALATEAVRQFRAQTYPFKKLIILNHHPHARVLGQESFHTMMTDNNDVYEIHVDKDTHGLTLGQLRNMLLELVPMHASWTIWDDDDWRSPDYMSALEAARQKFHVDAIALTQRYEYNKKTDFAWKVRVKNGLPIVLCRAHPSIKYMHKNTMEDVHLLRDIHLHLRSIKLLANDPRIYIRLVHQDNTSLYVNSQKKEVGHTKHNRFYFEDTLSSKEENYVRENIKSLFSSHDRF